jgi:hypothetical protein
MAALVFGLSSVPRTVLECGFDMMVWLREGFFVQWQLNGYDYVQCRAYSHVVRVEK